MPFLSFNGRFAGGTIDFSASLNSGASVSVDGAGRPLAAGMAAAPPYVDHFLPAASLADLERLKRTLAGLG